MLNDTLRNPGNNELVAQAADTESETVARTEKFDAYRTKLSEELRPFLERIDYFAGSDDIPDYKSRIIMLCSDLRCESLKARLEPSDLHEGGVAFGLGEPTLSDANDFILEFVYHLQWSGFSKRAMISVLEWGIEVIKADEEFD